VDRERALERLAGPYARALRLAEEGRSSADIAADLGIDPAAVDSLLEIGAGNLARLMADDDPPSLAP
jgi:DNA-directed RNA polymerase specialized sigma24 family protein